MFAGIVTAQIEAVAVHPAGLTDDDVERIVSEAEKEKKP